jgi:nucleotide-binding universal stress UspA family protein
VAEKKCLTVVVCLRLIGYGLRIALVRVYEGKMKKKIVSAKFLKVIWAVDAFHENPKTQLRALQSFLKMNGGAGSAEIQPVAVLHSGSYDPVTHTFPENWHEVASDALGNIIDTLEDVANAGVLPARLIKVDEPSLSASVDALIQFAIEENASFILVSSRARTGIDRLALGSFAETLVLRSPVPVFIANPQTKTHQKLRTILYPTDFSAASKKGFDRVLTVAQRQGMQILIYHKIDLPYWPLNSGLVLPPVSRESLRELKAERIALAEKWAQRAELSGVRAKYQIESQGGPTLDSILEISRRLGPKVMIGVTSQSGSVGALILGSLTRQILRTASCPVLVVHSDQPSLAKKFVNELRLSGYTYTAHPLIS